MSKKIQTPLSFFDEEAFREYIREIIREELDKATNEETNISTKDLGEKPLEKNVLTKIRVIHTNDDRSKEVVNGVPEEDSDVLSLLEGFNPNSKS